MMQNFSARFFPPRVALAALFALAALLFSAAASAQSPKAGVDYILLDPPQPERVDADKIEVIEFFNFSCPHCFRLQRPFGEWKRNLKNPDDVAILHQPVVFQRFNGHYAKVYYTLDALGIAEEYAPKVYRAIHGERALLNSQGRFLDWLEDNGVDRDKAEAVYDSFSVNSRAQRAASLAGEYGIDSTPQIAVAGKYVLNARLSGSYEKMMSTLSALVERERKLREQG